MLKSRERAERSERILKPTNTLVMDVEGFKIAIMQKGVLQMKVTVYGKKAHERIPGKAKMQLKSRQKR